MGDLVKTYRMIFKKEYWYDLLDYVENLDQKEKKFVVTVPFCRDAEKQKDIGFKGFKIVVNLDGPQRKFIHASNQLFRSSDDDGTLTALIHVNPNIVKTKTLAEKILMKYVLAHEWYEVIETFDEYIRKKDNQNFNIQNLRKQKILTNKSIPYFALLQEMGRPTPQQDTESYLAELKKQLKRLLVSRSSFDELLQEHSYSISKLEEDVNQNPHNSAGIIKSWSSQFSEKMFVDKKWVEDRILIFVFP